MACVAMRLDTARDGDMGAAETIGMTAYSGVYRGGLWAVWQLRKAVGGVEASSPCETLASEGGTRGCRLRCCSAGASRDGKRHEGALSTPRHDVPHVLPPTLANL